MKIFEPKQKENGLIELMEERDEVKFTKEEFDHISRHVNHITENITIKADGRYFVCILDPRELMELIQREIN